MNQLDITKQMEAKYGEFVHHIQQMKDEDYFFRQPNKWNAAQQLNHLVLSVQPLVYVYTLPNSVIEAKFGRVERLNKTYEELKTLYQSRLEQGGKAPEQFVPQKEVVQAKEELIQQLIVLVDQLNEAILKLAKTDFESLQIPHPLLGLITLKEMAYNAIYHVEHHQKAMITSLDNKKRKP